MDGPLTDIEIDQVYTIQNARMKYTNIILSSGIKTQEILLRKGNIILGFGQCRVTEYIDLIQCQNCNRYGHLRRTCNFESNCRKCGQAHDTDTCNVANAIPNCHNCLIANQHGANYNPRHNVTDDRCPIKKQRINTLKIQLLQKNQLEVKIYVLVSSNNINRNTGSKSIRTQIVSRNSQQLEFIIKTYLELEPKLTKSMTSSR